VWKHPRTIARQPTSFDFSKTNSPTSAVSLTGSPSDVRIQERSHSRSHYYEGCRLNRRHSPLRLTNSEWHSEHAAGNQRLHLSGAVEASQDDEPVAGGTAL
jgi:hypothetical protein